MPSAVPHSSSALEAELSDILLAIDSEPSLQPLGRDHEGRERILDKLNKANAALTNHITRCNKGSSSTFTLLALPKLIRDDVHQPPKKKSSIPQGIQNSFRSILSDSTTATVKRRSGSHNSGESGVAVTMPAPVLESVQVKFEGLIQFTVTEPPDPGRYLLMSYTCISLVSPSVADRLYALPLFSPITTPQLTFPLIVCFCTLYLYIPLVPFRPILKIFAARLEKNESVAQAVVLICCAVFVLTEGLQTYLSADITQTPSFMWAQFTLELFSLGPAFIILLHGMDLNVWLQVIQTFNCW
jgi:hypothetical protein